jgi:hypothetical protein
MLTKFIFSYSFFLFVILLTYFSSKDPEFLKIVKVQLLQTIASPITVEKILIEFEYDIIREIITSSIDFYLLN